MIDVSFAVIENSKQRSELADFYYENKNRFYSIALSKLNNEEEAEDAVQEVFSKIADKPEKFFEIPIGNRLAYISVIVRNTAVDMYNSKIKAPVEHLEEFEDSMVSLDDKLFDKISRDEILKFIDSLPDSQRSVLMLHCLMGFTIDETAQRLNISLTAANKRLTLARRAIRKFIDERNIIHE